MHLSIHIDGNEAPEKLRRIANAVLAIGGLPSDDYQESGEHALVTGPFTSEVKYEDFTGATSLAERLPINPERIKAARTEPNVQVDGGDGTVRAEANPEAVHASVTDAVSGETRTVELPVRSAQWIATQSNLMTPPPVPTTSAVDASGTDANGLPWDERIHSGSRAVNADGTWRYRKNVPAETKLAVEGELKALIGGAVAGKGGYVITSVGVVDEQVLADKNTVITPPVPPTFADTATAVASAIAPPLPPPVPTGLTRSYSDVVNIIMSRKIKPEVFVAILGSDLPTFAATCRTDAGAATLAFNALDHASRA